MIISSVRNGPLLSRGAVVKATDQRHLLQNPTYVSREDLFAWAPPGAPPRYYIRTFSRTNWVDSIREMPNPVGACYMTSRAATISGDPNAEFPPKCYSKNLDGQMRRMRAESNRWHGTARGTNLDLCQGWVGADDDTTGRS